MRERPIIMSGESVHAILAGRKTQTRRVVALQQFGRSDTRGYDWTFRDRRGCWNDYRDADLPKLCPYGVPGDRLWVRETWHRDQSGGVRGYYADYDWSGTRVGGVKVVSPLYMPRWASRITLDVVSVRAERLQEISEEDAKAEGVEAYNEDGAWVWTDYELGPGAWYNTARGSYVSLWNSINAKRPGCAWADSPWVWIIEFRRIAHD